jgi:hypothetical protein
LVVRLTISSSVAVEVGDLADQMMVALEAEVVVP